MPVEHATRQHLARHTRRHFSTAMALCVSHLTVLPGLPPEMLGAMCSLFKETPKGF